MTPETKKTLIYGGVISFAIAAGLYIYSRYENQNNAAATGADPTAANAAAQAAADAAAQQEVQLSELASFSGGGGASLSSPSLGTETPHDNFAQEIAAILQAAGLGAPVSTTPGSPTPVSTLPGVVASNPAPPAPTDGQPPKNTPHPVGPEPSPARNFNHILADERYLQ